MRLWCGSTRGIKQATKGMSSLCGFVRMHGIYAFWGRILYYKNPKLRIGCVRVILLGLYRLIAKNEAIQTFAFL